MLFNLSRMHLHTALTPKATGPVVNPRIRSGGHSLASRPRCRRRCTASITLAADARASASAITTVPHTASRMVDEVLHLIQGTDGGIDMSETSKARVDELLAQLEEVGSQQQPRPLNNPLLWGDYEVAYTSTRQAKQQTGQPSGGRFRGRLGRLLFPTAGLFQSVHPPDLATNKVGFKLLGCIEGAVGLRGKVTPVGATGDTVRVDFERPVLSLGALHLRIGPESNVQLTTTYLDERVRLGKGSRGSLFVFTRGGAAATAGMQQVGLQATSRAAAALVAAAMVGMVLGAAALWLAVPHLAAKAAAAILLTVGLGIAAVLRSGGIIRDDNTPAAAFRTTTS